MFSSLKVFNHFSTLKGKSLKSLILLNFLKAFTGKNPQVTDLNCLKKKKYLLHALNTYLNFKIREKIAINVLLSNFSINCEDLKLFSMLHRGYFII